MSVSEVRLLARISFFAALRLAAAARLMDVSAATAEKLAAGLGSASLDEKQALPSLLATRALKEKRYALAGSGFPDREAMLFTFARSSEINSQLVSVPFSGLLPNAAPANVEGESLQLTIRHVEIGASDM